MFSGIRRTVTVTLGAGVQNRDTSRRAFLRLIGCGMAGAAIRQRSCAAEPGAKQRPDIIVIMVDDMGFSDIGCYGGEIRTPNLDGLAANGIRFTQFYNTARCCPSRASLLTGLYAHQADVGHMVGDSGIDGYHGDLSRDCVTIAEALRPAGYGTYMSGKWHVTRHTKPDGPKDNWPRQRGFERYYGTLVGAGSFYTPKALTLDNTPIEAPTNGFYYTDAISDHAVQFIAEHHEARASEPFFLYVAYTAPHWPLHAPKEDIERYRGTYMKGWDALREERHRRMTELGIVHSTWPLTPRDPQATPWEEVPEEKRVEMDSRMAVYAAQIDRVDQGIGRILAELKRAGRYDDTLVMFLADNGGCAEGGPWGFERKEGGELGTDNSFASYGLAWANASNTPFRRYKHWVHEGGIATPFIAHWPAGIKAKGDLRRQPGHIIDIMATCVDVAGAPYPTEHDGTPITPLEGRSLAPAFAGLPVQREALFWEHEGNRAVRRGKWKLVSKHPGEWELYDLEADRTELDDLATQRPDKVEELTSLYAAWAERCGVRPWPVRRKKAKKAAGLEKTEFTLKQGDTLPQERAPRVNKRSFAITATVDRAGKDGVIVAQGGSRVGYALYVKDGKLTFTCRNNSRPVTVQASTALPNGQANVGAALARDGKMTLKVNGTDAASGQTDGLLYDMPTEGLEVGSDRNAPVGDYTAPNDFKGTIEHVHILLHREAGVLGK